MKQQLALSTPAERKVQLLREGEHYRHGVVAAQTAIAGHFGASLVRTMFSHLIGALGRGASLQRVFPLVLTTVSFLARKRWLWPVIGIGMVAATVTLLVRKRDR